MCGVMKLKNITLIKKKKKKKNIKNIVDSTIGIIVMYILQSAQFRRIYDLSSHQHK